MGNSLAVNEPAPDFALKDGDGAEWRLSDHRGQVVVLLFYPGDETPVCTRQMCSLGRLSSDRRGSSWHFVRLS